MNFTLKQLRVFVTVAQAGSFVEADFIAFLDSGSSNGGVKERYVTGRTVNLVPVTTHDASTNGMINLYKARRAKA